MKHARVAYWKEMEAVLLSALGITRW